MEGLCRPDRGKCSKSIDGLVVEASASDARDPGFSFRTWIIFGVKMSIYGSPCKRFVCWLLACLTSEQPAVVSQGRICSTLRVAILRQKMLIKLSTSRYTDTGPTSPVADPIKPGA